MSTRFITKVEIPSDGSFTLGDFIFEFAKLTPEEEATVREEAASWKVYNRTEEKVDHDDWGSYYVDGSTYEVKVLEMSSLAEETNSGRVPIGDVLVKDGHFAGVVIYCGRNTDRYGVHSFCPLTADPYYGISPSFIRPDKGEVYHGFGILYTDGTFEGNRKGNYAEWGSRSNTYEVFNYSLEKD